MTRDLAPDSTDILCEDCGYCLNGLPNTGNCPECGNLISRSTTDSPRKDPPWENTSISPAWERFITTARAILFHPKLFFKTLTLRKDNPTSKRFMMISLIAASLINSITIILHYLATTQIGPAVAWLPSLVIQIILIPILSYFVWWGTFELTGYLSTIEGRYWGYRMQRQHVRRAIQYVTVHLPVISLLPMLIVLTYTILVWFRLDFGLYMMEYLYVLSGGIVISAIYLFKIYWAAMKAILYGNPADMSHIPDYTTTS